MIIRVDILDPYALVYNDCRVVELSMEKVKPYCIKLNI
jgi:hypothetical protein